MTNERERDRTIQYIDAHLSETSIAAFNGALLIIATGFLSVRLRAPLFVSLLSVTIIWMTVGVVISKSIMYTHENS